MKILACQIDVPRLTTASERDDHVNIIAEKICRCLSQEHADLVVLPELSSIDYSRAAFDNLSELAESLDGPTYSVFRELCVEFQTAVVYGIPRLRDDGYRITQVALGADGTILGHFDKLHIAQFGYSMEKEYFQKGDHLFVFKHKGINIAPVICYDIRIPELTRTLVINHDVQLVLHCGAYGRDESFDNWHDFVKTRALENQIYLLSLNRAGKNYGHSLFCGPWSDQQNPAFEFPQHDEALIYLEIDPATITKTRENYSFLADRFKSYADLNVIKSEV